MVLKSTDTQLTSGHLSKMFLLFSSLLAAIGCLKRLIYSLASFLMCYWFHSGCFLAWKRRRLLNRGVDLSLLVVSRVFVLIFCCWWSASEWSGKSAPNQASLFVLNLPEHLFAIPDKDFSSFSKRANFSLSLSLSASLVMKK